MPMTTQQEMARMADVMVLEGEVEQRLDPLPVPLLGRVVRGLVGGELAGAVFVLVTVWFMLDAGAGADAPFLMMSTIAAGSDALATGDANVTLGVLVHLGVAALYGALFGLVAPRLRTNGTLLLAAGVFGIVVYLINFQILSPLFFPAFQEVNQSFEVLVHILYGQLVAVMFLSRGVRSGEPVFEWR